jgi:hypothetical protein
MRLVVVSGGGLVGHAEDDTPHAAGSTLHGMWTAPWEWYAPWKSIDGRAVVESATGAMKTLVEGLFTKERLLDYLRHFIAFEVVNEKIEKKGAKYHQFFGIRFAVEEALRATRPDGDGKIGVVWHTQGSGKSLSMAYFVAILRHHPQMENPTFVIQLDRTDSDDQLHDQFVAVKALVGEVQHGTCSGRFSSQTHFDAFQRVRLLGCSVIVCKSARPSAATFECGLFPHFFDQLWRRSPRASSFVSTCGAVLWH